MSGKWYTVGKLVNTHGIRGDVKILSQTDFADERFAPGSELLLVDEASGQSQTVTIESSRMQKNMYVVRFKGVNNINEVEKFKGWTLKVSEENQGELDDGEYYYHQIIGCSVMLEDGTLLGTISEILAPGANDVWVVEQAGNKNKSILLPVIDDVVLNVDIQQKQVTVRLLEGLM